MIRIRGPAKAFATVKQRIELAKRGDAMDAVKKTLAATAVTEVGKGFREERDPYGAGWAPLKHRQGRILSLTGRLRRSFTVEMLARGFRVLSAANYAIHHQFGAPRARIPARHMVPVKTRGLGPIWDRAFKQAASRAVRRLLRKG